MLSIKRKTPFLQNGVLRFIDNPNNWRRGVFRYAMSIYNQSKGGGKAFIGEYPIFAWHKRGINTFWESATDMQMLIDSSPDKDSDFLFACHFMHEAGHTLGIDRFFPFGCDSQRSIDPNNLLHHLFKNYKSCMNLRYEFDILDYSNGENGWGDHDDWGNLDLTFFEPRFDIILKIHNIRFK